MQCASLLQIQDRLSVFYDGFGRSAAASRLIEWVKCNDNFSLTFSLRQEKPEARGL